MSAVRRNGLGKGLGAIFEEIQTPLPASVREAEDSAYGSAGRMNYIDVNNIKPNADQPRKQFSDETIDELAVSIRTHGVIQPLLVRPAKRGFEIVAGERRWRAARRAGLRTVPCVVRETDDEQNAMFALIENMQREDLNPIEEAEAIERVMREFDFTQEDVSRSVGKSRPYITNALRLLKLPPEVRAYLRDGVLTSGHGKAVASVSDAQKQIRLAEYMVENGCSVREAETLAADPRFGARRKPAAPRAKNPAISAIEEELTAIVGTRVGIRNRGERGKIELSYYSRDELEGLIELLRGLSE